MARSWASMSSRNTAAALCRAFRLVNALTTTAAVVVLDAPAAADFVTSGLAAGLGRL
jgi:hypothetical protein